MKSLTIGSYFIILATYPAPITTTQNPNLDHPQPLHTTIGKSKHTT